MAKLADKLTKANESFTINRYDNGFMIEVSGRDSDDEWKTAKILCNTEDELVDLVREAVNLPKDE
jgi:hypothetical protein